MAYFRLITGEEEAAAAVIHSLRRWRYQDAARLNPKSHIHKLALRPFVFAVLTFFVITRSKMAPGLVSGPAGDRICTRVPDDESGVGLVDPPLDFAIYENECLYDFRDGIEIVGRRKGLQSILQQVREKARMRRQILYGSTEGYWILETVDSGLFEGCRATILSHLLLFLMIDPYPTHQLLVKQCLPVFLKVVELLPGDD